MLESKRREIMSNEKEPVTGLQHLVSEVVDTKPRIREFIQMKFGPIFIFGVAAGNTSDNNTWDMFKVYGSLDSKAYGEANLTCCFKFINGSDTLLRSVVPLVRRFFSVGAAMWSYYLACPNIKNPGLTIPIGVSVTLFNNTCSEDQVSYVRPYFPLKEPNKIAIGTKTAFGNISAELIIEWMEAYKYLGVNKVVTYYMKGINGDALKVLQYYETTGILDLFYYEPANEEKYPRIAIFAGQGGQVWNDQQVVVDDSFERCSGYQYFGIIDHDEFFIPSKNRTLLETLEALSTINEKSAAGYVLQTQYFYLSWGESSNRSDLILQRFIQREEKAPRLDNMKNIYTPQRVALGGVDTHVIGPATGYKMYLLDADYGYIRHFRKCRAEKQQECMNMTRVVDHQVADWSETFRDNILNARRIIFGH